MRTMTTTTTISSGFLRQRPHPGSPLVQSAQAVLRASRTAPPPRPDARATARAMLEDAQLLRLLAADPNLH